MPHRRFPGQHAYDELRAAVLNGDLPVGHIDIQQIADRFGVSPTPVREALARLASEQLILFNPGQGYTVANPTAKALCDLYVWTDRVARFALELSGGSNPSRPGALDRTQNPAPPDATRYAQDVASLFEEIAHASSNGEFASKIAESNARLFRARTVEWSVLTELQQELSQLIALWRQGELGNLSARISDYFLRRIDRCEDIAQELLLQAN